MATIIALRRPRPLKPGAALSKAPANQYSAEQFFRKSMLPASIVMGAIIVLTVSTLFIGLKTGMLGHDAATWVLVAALVSVIGLTKIIVANMFFYIMVQDDARLDEPAPAPPPRGPIRQTRPLRMPPRAPAERRRRPGGGRIAALPRG